MARRINGTHDNDIIHSGNGSEIINAKAGDDIVSSGASADKVFGKGGDDTISLGSGSDKAYAGSDDDIVNGDHGSDIIYGGSGDDILYGGDVTPSDSAASSSGGIDDSIWGGSGDDLIFGQSGNDYLLGQGGDDELSGQNGADIAHGGAGLDILSGGSGNDELHGDGDDDTISGNAGNDALHGGPGADLLHGNSGFDVLYGDEGNDVLYGNDGNDIIYSGVGNDIVFGGGADDQIDLFDGNDNAVGGAGDDQIDGGRGNDVIYGDRLPENLLSGSTQEFGQSIAQFSGSDWLVSENAQTNQIEMSQTVHTDADRTYTAHIDVAANFAAGHTSGALEVLWDDQIIDKIEVQTGAFETVSYDVVGTGGATGLAIRTAEPDNPVSSIYDTSGPIISYEKTIDLGDGEMVVDAFAPGQAKLFQTIDGQLQVFDTTTKTYVGAGPETGVKVNAIGFNIQDDLIYGYAKATGVDALGHPISDNSLVMMDAKGQIYKLGDGDYADFVGDFDGQGNLYTFHSSLDRVTKIDVDELDADGNPDVETFYFPQSLSTRNIYDIAHNPVDGMFYGIVAPGSVGGEGKVSIVDLTGIEQGHLPAIAEVPITHTEMNGSLYEGMAKGAFGAVFMDGTGNLYTGLNNGDHDLAVETEDSGAIYRIEFDETGRTATAELMSVSQSTGNNDGAMDTRGNDPFADIDASANILVKNIEVFETESMGWDDNIFGGDGEDVIYAGGRHDTINGGHGNDQIFGEAGHDIIHGLDGDDAVSGGSGNDEVFGGVGGDNLDGGNGNDILSGGADNDHVAGASGNDQLYGNEGNDRLYGDGGLDHIYGGSGDDEIFGGTGNDVMSGGEDQDQIWGNQGNDQLSGDLGDDLLFGGTGNDYLKGGAGDDELSGDDGLDDLYGGSGADVIFGGSGADTIFGGADDDLLYGGKGKDYINGDDGHDIIYGGLGDDHIFGGNGHDRIEAGSGRNFMSGGDGSDRFIFLADNGSHHDVIEDYMCYGDNADRLDLTSHNLLAGYDNTDAWSSKCVSLRDDNSLFIKLGYGQSVTILNHEEVSVNYISHFIDTIEF